MYYLQSRYYDPAIGRFINADTFATTDGDGFLSCNMFAYCENDPVNHSDPYGELFWEAALGGAIAGAVVGASAYIINAAIDRQPIDSEKLLNSIAIGAVCGGIAGFLSPVAEIFGGICCNAMAIKAIGSLLNGTVAFTWSLAIGNNMYDSASSFLATTISTFVGLNLIPFPIGEGSSIYTATSMIGGITVGGCVEALSSSFRAVTHSSNPAKNNGHQYSGGGGQMVCELK